MGLCDDAVVAVKQWMFVTGRHLNQDYIIGAMDSPMTRDEMNLIPVAETWRESLKETNE
jgi:hypothetical protein